MNQAELFKRCKAVTPGGVHSPVRGFKGIKKDPTFMKQAKGAFITDESGKDYIDFCMSFGPLILGHNNPLVKESIIKAVERGWSFGACEKYSLELAEFIIQKNDFLDQIRFVNSGTEAVMTAIRLARGVTGKAKIIKFEGCYHGHVDSMLIKSGSGLAGTEEASSKGIPKNVAADTLVAPLNDIAKLEEIFSSHDDIAALIIEPMPANAGLIDVDYSFLKEIKEIAHKNNALVIFDEVISGFRASFGGIAELSKVTPDIVTYGKIIGGGMPVGAIAASKFIMEHLAPVGEVYQAGTLSANPVAMSAGLTTLKIISENGFYENLKKQTSLFIAALEEKIKSHENEAVRNYEIIQKHSLFWAVPNTNMVKTMQDVPGNLFEPFNELFLELMQKGIYLSPNPYEVGFISAAHDDKVLETLKERLWS